MGNNVKTKSSVADRDQGSGAISTPTSGIGKSFFSGSQIPDPTHISKSLATIFWVIHSNLFIYLFKKFNECQPKQVRQLIYFSLLFFCWIKDPGWKKIRIWMKIPDLQHCQRDRFSLKFKWKIIKNKTTFFGAIHSKRPLKAVITEYQL